MGKKSIRRLAYQRLILILRVLRMSGVLNEKSSDGERKRPAISEAPILKKPFEKPWIRNVRYEGKVPSIKRTI
jgi:hypothetical protein